MRIKHAATLPAFALIGVLSLGLTGCGGGAEADPAADAPTSQAPAEPVETTPEAPEVTASQQNAMDKANQYLSLSGFSRSGLIGQLEFEKFTTEDATFAVDNIGADWTEQAAVKAKAYNDLTPMSHGGLVDQLIFDGFTPEEAEAGVVAIGL